MRSPCASFTASNEANIRSASGQDSKVLIDRFNRPVIGVRISLTPSTGCNFKCVFCHMEGIYEEPSLMTSQEIQRIVHVLNLFGVELVKLTGGEPMLRPDIVEIVKGIRALLIREISMTTNGTRLSRLAEPLKEAGMKRVNISLHSLRESRYNYITGTVKHADVIEAIKASIDAGLTPVKLNVVVMKGVNDDEIKEMIDFCHKMGGKDKVVLQLIELVSEGEADYNFYKAFHIDLNSIEESLKKEAVKEIVRDLHFRHRYLLPNEVWVEVVRPMHNTIFCMGNNRMRITYDGKFKPCLLRHDNHIDFLKAMRNGASDNDLADLFKLAVQIREPFFKPTIQQKHA